MTRPCHCEVMLHTKLIYVTVHAKQDMRMRLHTYTRMFDFRLA